MRVACGLGNRKPSGSRGRRLSALSSLVVSVCQIALLDSPTALSMEEKLHQNEARVSLTPSGSLTAVTFTADSRSS